ncbi:MAG: hypothetical protein ACRD2X_20555 [Vicinamibacteraceae bacterium]
MNALRVAQGILTLLVCTACANGGGGRSHVALSPAYPTPERLARAVLDAFRERDRAKLARLVLSETEFRDAIWPDLPASRSGRNLPVDYAWGQLKQRSDGALAALFGRHAGQRYDFVRIEFTGSASEYGSFTVQRRSLITVRDANGGEQRLRLFGSAVIHNGQWKAFSYVVD